MQFLPEPRRDAGMGRQCFEDGPSPFESAAGTHGRPTKTTTNTSITSKIFKGVET